MGARLLISNHFFFLLPFIVLFYFTTLQFTYGDISNFWATFLTTLLIVPIPLDYLLSFFLFFFFSLKKKNKKK